MDIRSTTGEKLLSLQEAAQKLGVTPQTLLSWNEYQILKPTITVTGHIGYTEVQLEQFLRIYEAFRPLQPQEQLTSLPTSMAFPTPPMASASNLTPSSTQHKSHATRNLLSLALVSITLVIAIASQQERLSSFVKSLATTSQQEHLASKSPVSSSSVVSHEVLGFALPTTEKADESLGKNTKENTTSAFSQKTTNTATITQTSHTTIASNKKDTVPSATIAGVVKSLVNKPSTISSSPPRVEGVSTFASTIMRSNGQSIPNSSFDKSGNIAGSPRANALALSYANPDIAGSYSTSLPSKTLTNQLILIAIASSGSLLYFMKRPRKQHQTLATSPQTSDKILELDQKMDGTVVLYYQNKAYKISKPELHSDSDQFIERLMQLCRPPSKEMEYDATQDSMRLTAPLSRLVTRLGFVGFKRDLFFPRTSKHSVLFRKYVTQNDLDGMKLSPEEIISDLAPLN